MTSTSQAQIDLRARYFYLGCAAVLVLSFLSNVLFSQLSRPVLVDPGIDNTYWLMHWLGIPQAVTHSILWSAVLDLVLFFSALAAAAISGRRAYAILFSALLFVWHVTLSTYSIHHYHTLIGMLVLSVPFWFGAGDRFTYMWEAARYYFFFMFASAGLWKLTRGAIFDPLQMVNILKAQHAQYLYDHPDGLFAPLYTYLISHSGLSQGILISMMVIQLCFLGGFFTKRFDRAYLYIFILFIAMNYIVMHISSLPLLVFALVLIDWDRIAQKQHS